MKNNKYKFETLSDKIIKLFLFSYGLLYLIILSFCIATSVINKNLVYLISILIVLLFITILPVIVCYIIKSLLSPLSEINRYIQNLSQFKYYKNKHFFDIDEYNAIFNSIKNLSDILEETKLNYETYRKRINDYNTKKQIIEIQEKDLIYSISHELKTPISIIETGAYAIIDGIYEGEEAKKELEIIIEQCKVSISMIQSVLNVFKLSQEDFASKKVSYSLSDQVNSKINDFSDMIKKFNHKLTTNIEADVSISAVESQIGTVLSNSIQNAITYSPESSEIIISVKSVGNDSIFEIINTNVNIDETKLAHIFEPFTKVDESHTKKNYTGNGLGLYINKQILKKMNFDFGMINIENGVKFYFVGKKK